MPAHYAYPLGLPTSASISWKGPCHVGKHLPGDEGQYWGDAGPSVILICRSRYCKTWDRADAECLIADSPDAKRDPAHVRREERDPLALS